MQNSGVETVVKKHNLEDWRRYENNIKMDKENMCEGVVQTDVT
jgi:hypothetical protein